MASSAVRSALVGVDHRDVARGQEPGVDRAELEHAAVVGPGGGIGQIDVGGVLEFVQAPVVEGVEDQLAAEAQEVQGPGPIFGDERPRGGEVLALHDLDRFGGPVVRGSMAVPELLEGGHQVALLRFGTPGLAQLVAARVLEHREAIAEGCLGVVPQPGGCLHDVGVGIVDEPSFVVGHLDSSFASLSIAKARRMRSSPR